MSTDILKRILVTKAEEIALGKRHHPLEELKAKAQDLGPTRDFADAIKSRAAQSQDAVIAEIKKASPSAGIIRDDFDPVWLAQSYERGGAAALSVLTDEEYFQGHRDYLVAAREACELPVIRKDFIIDAWQVWDSRVLGADAILLIVAALDDGQLHDLAGLAQSLELAVLVEVHDEHELERALKSDIELVGINNRDLHVFKTDLNTSLRLAPMIPTDRWVVSESGIHTPDDVAQLQAGGIGAFLIGESLMRQPDPGLALRNLFVV